MFEFITVRELYELYINDRNQLDGIEYVELQGWIRTNRNSGKVGFLALNDGTYFKNVQVVYLDEIIDNYEEASHISTGSAVKVTGKLKLTPDGKQPFEIPASLTSLRSKPCPRTSPHSASRRQRCPSGAPGAFPDTLRQAVPSARSTAGFPPRSFCSHSPAPIRRKSRAARRPDNSGRSTSRYIHS